MTISEKLKRNDSAAGDVTQQDQPSEYSFFTGNQSMNSARSQIPAIVPEPLQQNEQHSVSSNVIVIAPEVKIESVESDTELITDDISLIEEINQEAGAINNPDSNADASATCYRCNIKFTTPNLLLAHAWHHHHEGINNPIMQTAPTRGTDPPGSGQSTTLITPKVTANRLTVKEKIDILKFCDENPHFSLRKIAEHVKVQLGRSITRTAILNIKRKKDLILQSEMKTHSDTQVKVKKRIELDFETDFGKGIDISSVDFLSVDFSKFFLNKKCYVICIPLNK